MCDTMVAFATMPTERSFFAKNSDREPGELQVVHFSMNPRDEFYIQPYIELKNKYITSSFNKLSSIFKRFDHPYPAIISRPTWIWGAEMGVNLLGLAIGNEAVFSKEKVADDGLLGMDILRLALHNCRTAKEGLDFIIELIEEYGQGGDGGYTKPLKYHNSFLIKDSREAYLLETSAKHWAAKKIESWRTISNSYSLLDDYDLCDSGSANIKSFKAQYENKLFTFFTKGNQRQSLSASHLEKNSLDLSSLKDLLRSHVSSRVKPRRGMRSLCVHSGRVIKSETTSSMIIDYLDKKTLVWFTASPHPCISLFKPLILPKIAGDEMTVSDNLNDFLNLNSAAAYSHRLRNLSKRIDQDHHLFQKRIKPLRDELETAFIKKVYENLEQKTEANLLDDCAECLRLEKTYLQDVVKILEKRWID